jgi:hypothetical protein
MRKQAAPRFPAIRYLMRHKSPFPSEAEHFIGERPVSFTVLFLIQSEAVICYSLRILMLPSQALIL